MASPHPLNEGPEGSDEASHMEVPDRAPWLPPNTRNPSRQPPHNHELRG